MAQLTEPLVAKDTVRVTVIATDTSPTDDPSPQRGHHRVDLSMSTSLSIADTAIEVARAVSAELTKRRINTDWLSDPDSALELAPPVGEGWDQTLPMSELGLCNGDRIVLTVRRANERYPRLYENLADAAAWVRSKTFGAWDATTSHNFAASTLPAGTAACAIIGASAAVRHNGLTQWVITAAFAVAALLVSIAAVTAAQYRSTAVATPSVGIAMHALLAATAACAVPSSGWSLWNLAAASVVITASSGGMIALQAPKVWTHVAVFAAGASTTTGLAVVWMYSLWREVSPAAAAAVVATVAFLFYLANVSLARKFARLDMPVLPTPGEDIDMRQTHNLAELSQEISTSQSWGALIHSEDRNIAARFASLGIMIGTGSVATVCAAVAGATVTEDTLRLVVPEIDGRWVGLLTFAVLSALFVLRGTWNIDRGLCTAGIISGSMVGLGYLAGVALLGHDDSTIRVAGMVVVVLALVLFSATLLFRASELPTSEKRVKALQFLETVLMVLVLTDALTMLNVFFSVRSR